MRWLCLGPGRLREERIGRPAGLFVMGLSTVGFGLLLNLRPDFSRLWVTMRQSCFSFMYAAAFFFFFFFFLFFPLIALIHVMICSLKTNKHIKKNKKNLSGSCVSPQQTPAARVWAAAKSTWVNGAMLMQQIYTTCECGTSEQTMQHLLYWEAHFLKNECSLKIWRLLKWKGSQSLCKSLAKHMTQFRDDGHEEEYWQIYNFLLKASVQTLLTRNYKKLCTLYCFLFLNWKTLSSKTFTVIF